MLMKLTMWASILTLFPSVFWRPSASYETLLQFVVCASALLLVWQVGFAGRAWAVAFNGEAGALLARKPFDSLFLTDVHP